VAASVSGEQQARGALTFGVGHGFGVAADLDWSGVTPTLAERVRGTAMLVVEQHLSFVLGLADRFAVFKRGEVVDTGSVDVGSAARIDEHMRL